MTDKNRVKIFDTTLRDGEQSPGAAMTFDQKLQIAEMLDRQLRVDIIEAGFPNASNGDFEAVKAIAGRAEYAVIAGLARAQEADIRRAAEAVKGARRPRIHTFIATSPIHMEHKLQMQPTQVLEIIEGTVSLARNLTAEVEWSAEDATRSDYDFLEKAIETAIRAGATIINIPDTVGYAQPREYGNLIERLCIRFAVFGDVIFSTHCHDDLGCAVANSLAGVRAGARQVECTINGIGERAGNAALEEIVMAIRTRPDYYKTSTGVITPEFSMASRLVASATGIVVQSNKAIVGKNAFAHESGIHQDGMLKNPDTYQIMKPGDVGKNGVDLPLGKLSGRAALKQKLAELGYELGGNVLQDVFTKFKELADRKRVIYVADLIALVEGETASAEDRIRVVKLFVKSGIDETPTASIELHVGENLHQGIGEGDGPVDAVINAICKAYPHSASARWEVEPVTTDDTDAQARVNIQLRIGERVCYGRGVDSDTLVATAYAYTNALSQSLRPPTVHSQA